MKGFYAGGFFYNPKTREVLLHKRDGNTKNNPNQWAFFGGLGESDENPIEAFIREIEEELGVMLSVDEVIPLCDYYNPVRQTHRNVFYVVSDRKKSEMTLGEGADFDWVSLDTVFDYDLTERTARDLKTFLSIL